MHVSPFSKQFGRSREDLENARASIRLLRSAVAFHRHTQQQLVERLRDFAYRLRERHDREVAEELEREIQTWRSLTGVKLSV